MARNWSQAEIEATCWEILDEAVGVDPAKRDLNVMLGEDLGADSLDCFEICMRVEEDFELIEITDDESERVVRFRDLTALVAAKVSDEGRFTSAVEDDLMARQMSLISE